MKNKYIIGVSGESGVGKTTIAKIISLFYGVKNVTNISTDDLHKWDRKNPKSDEMLIVASYMGGLSLTYSEVGVCHALSYGLSMVLHTHHGLANCIAFKELEDVYGDYVGEFNTMVAKHKIELPSNLSAGWSEETIDAMVEVAIKLEHMWNHAFGENWQEVLDRERIKNWYKRM